MVKLTSSDALAILRKFDLASFDHVPRHVEHLKITHPVESNTLATFRFQKTIFLLLVDDAAEDDEAYIREQFRGTNQEIQGTLIKNPKDELLTYGMPFKGKDVYLFEVSSHKKRLDAALAKQYPDVSRSTWQKYIKAGYVSVNGEIEHASKTEVTDADTIAAQIPDATDYSEESLPIIYIDDNVIVINKPVGVLSHSKGAIQEEFTVADFFARYTTYNSDTNRPGIVHRLDRDTSGVMIGARNEETAKLLQQQFADRRAKKTYYAVISGHLSQPEAVIDLPIGRHPSSPSTFRVDPGGKSAQTTYSVIEAGESKSFVELRPKTGRTHQLRVHMAHLGAPIHGDKVYGKAADRLYLHAHSLEVTIPVGNRKIFTAPMPPEFDRALL